MFIAILIGLIVNARGHLHLNWHPPNKGFDEELYKRVLDAEQCQKQLDYLTTSNSTLLFQFLDAGIRIPRGLLQGNTLDMGNYFQCLKIDQNIDSNMTIKGKYCAIQVSINQSQIANDGNIQWPFSPTELINKLDSNISKNIMDYEKKHSRLKTLFGMETSPNLEIENLVLRLSLCIPTPCTTREALEELYVNVTSVGLNINDDFCRLPNDKPWVPGDYVAIVILSIIGLLAIIGTSYEVIHRRKPNKSQRMNELMVSFSLLKNSRDLFNISKKSGTMDCLDGIRALSMLWVVVGHSFITQNRITNMMDTFSWLTSIKSLWVIAAPIAVDTFFMISGLLLVYGATKKLTSKGLLRNLHMFYILRLLRMFPVLAFVILTEATLLNHISDGPYWKEVASNSEKCKTYWWSTLLHIQNFVNTERLCLPVSWYLNIDVQLHILSPLVLYWVLMGKRLLGWGALTLATLGTITAATIYNFYNNFNSSLLNTKNLNAHYINYMIYYYMNTLPRASPFLVGMTYGYLLHLYRDRKVNISLITNSTLWILALGLKALILYIPHSLMQPDWDNQTLDNVINSFMRPAWALALGWLIFACAHGYGGPINWFLSLKFWKIPARLSYALYLVHYSLMSVINSSRGAPIHFSVGNIMFYMFAYLFMSLQISAIVTILIDLPFANLLRLMMMRRGVKKNESKL